MGLDMYLHRKENVYGEPAIEIKKANKLPLRDEEHPQYEWVQLVTECAYWRKANAIHKWFINNCGEGDENRRTMEVSLEDLKELLRVCREVLQSIELVDGKVSNGYTIRKNSKGKIEKVYNFVDGKVIKDATICKKLLSTCSGFFFGSTDYDEYYVECIQETIEQLEGVIKDAEESDKDVWFEYYASW